MPWNFGTKKASVNPWLIYWIVVGGKYHPQAKHNAQNNPQDASPLKEVLSNIVRNPAL